jgi:hypothetical protein
MLRWKAPVLFPMACLFFWLASIFPELESFVLSLECSFPVEESALSRNGRVGLEVEDGLTKTRFTAGSTASRPT